MRCPTLLMARYIKFRSKFERLRRRQRDKSKIFIARVVDNALRANYGGWDELPLRFFVHQLIQLFFSTATVSRH